MDEDLNSLNTGHLATTGTIDSSTCTDYEDVRSNSNNDGLDSDVFTCLVCFIPFYSKLELLKHLSKIHRLTNLCRICYFDVKKIERFANPVSLRNHNLKCHSEKMVKCVCGSMLINSRMLMSHLKKFKCDISIHGANKNIMVKCICGKRFSSQEQIIHHQSKCRKRWRYGDMFNDSTSSTSITHSQNRRTRAQTININNEASLRQQSLMEPSQNLNTIQAYSHTGSGRKPNRRKCKENIQSGEEKMDEMFRKAVVSSLYESTPYAVSDNFQTSHRTGSSGNRNDSLRTSTVTLGKDESSSVSEDKELDLRTVSVKNRSDNASSLPYVSEQVDVNNNMSCVASAHAALLLDDVTTYCVANGNHNVSNMTVQNSSNLEEIDDNNNNISEMKGSYSNSATMKITKNILPGCTHVSNKTGKSKMKLANLKEISKRKDRDIKAKHRNRKYACKFCGRLYTKPYLYSHQKVVHPQAHWIHVPMSTALAKPAGKYKFRCYWCHFVSAHWTIAVQHHYKHHQDKELNILCLATS